MKIKAELKPCPFCGSEDIDVACYTDDGSLEVAIEEGPAFIHCWGCDMDYFPSTDIPEDVVKAWNVRS